MAAPGSLADAATFDRAVKKTRSGDMSLTAADMTADVLSAVLRGLFTA